jgi:hypothetical protein
MADLMPKIKGREPANGDSQESRRTR